MLKPFTPNSNTNNPLLSEERFVYMGGAAPGGVVSSENIQAEERAPELEQQVEAAEQNLPQIQSQVEQVEQRALQNINRLPVNLRDAARQELTVYISSIENKITSAQRETREAREMVRQGIQDEVSNYNKEIREANLSRLTPDQTAERQRAYEQQAAATRIDILAGRNIETNINNTTTLWQATKLKEIFEMQDKLHELNTAVEMNPNNAPSELEKAEMMSQLANALSIRLAHIDCTSGPHAMIGGADMNRMKQLLENQVDLSALPATGALSLNNLRAFYENLQVMRENPADTMVVNNEDGFIFLRSADGEKPKAYPLYTQPSNSVSRAPRFQISEYIPPANQGNDQAINQNSWLQISYDADKSVRVRLNPTDGKIQEVELGGGSTNITDLLTRNHPLNSIQTQPVDTLITWLQEAKARNIQETLNPEGIDVSRQTVDNMWKYGIGVRDAGLGTFNMPDGRVLMLNNGGNTESISAQEITVGDRSYLKILVYHKGGTQMDVVTFSKGPNSNRGTLVSFYQNIPRTSNFEDYAALRETLQSSVSDAVENERAIHTQNNTNAPEDLQNTVQTRMNTLANVFEGNAGNTNRLSRPESPLLRGYQTARNTALENYNHIDTEVTAAITDARTRLQNASDQVTQQSAAVDALRYEISQMPPGSPQVATLEHDLQRAEEDLRNAEGTRNSIQAEIGNHEQRRTDAQNELDTAQRRLDTVSNAQQLTRIPGTRETIVQGELSALDTFLTTLNGHSPTNDERAIFINEHLTIDNYHFTGYRGNIDQYRNHSNQAIKDAFTTFSQALTYNAAETGTFGYELREAHPTQRELIRRFILENTQVDESHLEISVADSKLNIEITGNANITDLSSLIGIEGAVITLNRSVTVTPDLFTQAAGIYGDKVNRIGIKDADANFNNPEKWTGKAAERAAILKDNYAALFNSKDNIQFGDNDITIKNLTDNINLTHLKSRPTLNIENLNGKQLTLPTGIDLKINAAGNPAPSAESIGNLLTANPNAAIQELKVKLTNTTEAVNALRPLSPNTKITNLELNIEGNYSDAWKGVITSICNDSTQLKYITINAAGWSDIDKNSCIEGITNTKAIVQIDSKIAQINTGNANTLLEDTEVNSQGISAIYQEILTQAIGTINVARYKTDSTILQITRGGTILPYGIQISKVSNKWIARFVNINRDNDNTTSVQNTPIDGMEFTLPQRGQVDQLTQLTQSIQTLSDFERSRDVYTGQDQMYRIRGELSQIANVGYIEEARTEAGQRRITTIIDVRASSHAQEDINRIIRSIGENVQTGGDVGAINVQLNLTNLDNTQRAQIKNINFPANTRIEDQTSIISDLKNAQVPVETLGCSNLDLSDIDIPTTTKRLEGISALPKNISDNTVKQTLETIRLTSGSGEIANFETLKNIRNLKNLEVRGRTLSKADIEGLSQCANLEELNLVNCMISDIGTNEIRIPNTVKNLNLSGTNITKVLLPATITDNLTLPATLTTARINAHQKVNTILPKIPASIATLDISGCAGLETNSLTLFTDLTDLTVSRIATFPNSLILPASLQHIRGVTNNTPITSLEIPHDIANLKTLINNSTSILNQLTTLKLTGTMDAGLNLALLEKMSGLTSLDLSSATLTTDTLSLPRNLTTLTLPANGGDIKRINAQSHRNPGALLAGISPRTGIETINFSTRADLPNQQTTNFNQRVNNNVPNYAQLLNNTNYPALKNIILSGTEAFPADATPLQDAINARTELVLMSNATDNKLTEFENLEKAIPALDDSITSTADKITNRVNIASAINSAIDKATEYKTDLETLRNRSGVNDQLRNAIQTQIANIETKITQLNQQKDQNEMALRELRSARIGEINTEIHTIINNTLNTINIESVTSQLQETPDNITPDRLAQLTIASLDQLIQQIQEKNNAINNIRRDIIAKRREVREIRDTAGFDNTVITEINNEQNRIQAIVMRSDGRFGGLAPICRDFERKVRAIKTLKQTVENIDGHNITSSNFDSLDANAKRLLRTVDITATNADSSRSIEGLTLDNDTWVLDLRDCRSASQLSVNLNNLNNLGIISVLGREENLGLPKNVRIICPPQENTAIKLTGTLAENRVEIVQTNNSTNIDLTELSSRDIKITGRPSIDLTTINLGGPTRNSVEITANAFIPRDYLDTDQSFSHENINLADNGILKINNDECYFDANNKLQKR